MVSETPPSEAYITSTDGSFDTGDSAMPSTAPTAPADKKIEDTMLRIDVGALV